MSSTLFVPFDFVCQSHKDKEIQFVDLAPGKKNRLFCSECKNKPDTIQSIDSVFKFLTDVQTKYTNIQQDFERSNRSLTEIKKNFNKYIDDFAQKIKEWEAQIESKKLIEESLLQKILQRTYQYSTQQLQEFLEGISNKIDTKNQQITVKKHYFSKDDKNFKDKITKKIQELTVFLNKQEVINYEIEQSISGPYSKQTEVAFPNEINVMEFNKDGTLLAVGNQNKVDDCFFSIWAIDEQNQLSLVQRLKDHTKALKCICFSSQNNQILTGSSDATAILWKQKVLKEWISAAKFQNTISINCLKFNHSSNQIAIGAGQLKVWKNDINEQWETFQLIEDHKKQVYCLDFNQDDSLLVSADQIKQIVVSKYSNNQWTTLFLLGCATQPILYLEFLTLKDFLSVSNNNEMIFWIFSEPIDEYECKIQKLDYQVTQTSYSKTSNTLALQYSKSVQMFNLLKYDLISIQGIELVSSSMQCSKDGFKIALFAENKLQIYTKKR